MAKLLKLFLFGLFLPCSFASFNFYMNGEEVRRILGLTKELYYVREGVPNTYALNFVVPIQPNVTFLSFTWESWSGTQGRVPPYSLSLTTSDPSTTLPSSSIPLTGTIPTKPTTFQIFLPCSGLKSTEVAIQLFLNVTLTTHLGDDKVLAFSLKRKKICLVGVKDPVKLPVQKKRKVSKLPKTAMEDKQLKTPDPNLIVLILASAFGVFSMFVLILGVAYLRRSRRRRVKGNVQHVIGTSTTSTTTNTKSCSNTSTTSSLIYDQKQAEEHLYSSVVGMNLAGDYVNCFGGGEYARVFRGVGVEDQDYPRIKRVQRQKVRLETLLQEGKYSRVYKATLQDDGIERSILVKTLSETMQFLHRQNIFEECEPLSRLTHENILSIFAITEVSTTPPFLIYDLNQEQYWNLKLFLSQLPNEELEALDLVQFGWDLAEGLEFLNGCGLVHGGVSARCCGLTFNGVKFTVKLSDGALAEDLFPQDYDIFCGGDRALRWTAPEEIFNPECKSTSGDVWSFGITFWEIFTSSKLQLYSSITNSTDLYSYLNLGYRLEKPDNCPSDVYTLMRKCWEWKPEARFTMRDIVDTLKLFISSKNDNKTWIV